METYFEHKSSNTKFMTLNLINYYIEILISILFWDRPVHLFDNCFIQLHLKCIFRFKCNMKLQQIHYKREQL